MQNHSSSLHIVKFGGSSVQNAEALGRVQQIVTQLASRQRLVVVLSAMGGITDLLLVAAHKAVTGGDCTPSILTFMQRHKEAVQALLPQGRFLDETLAQLQSSVDELELICKSLTVLREKTPRILDLTVSRGERMLARIFYALMTASGHQACYVDACEIVKVHRQFGTMFPDLDQSKICARAELLPRLDAGQIIIVPGYIGTGPEGELVTLGR